MIVADFRSITWKDGMYGLYHGIWVDVLHIHLLQLGHLRKDISVRYPVKERERIPNHYNHLRIFSSIGQCFFNLIIIDRVLPRKRQMCIKIETAHARESLSKLSSPLA